MDYTPPISIEELKKLSRFLLAHEVTTVLDKLPDKIKAFPKLKDDRLEREVRTNTRKAAVILEWLLLAKAAATEVAMAIHIDWKPLHDLQKELDEANMWLKEKDLARRRMKEEEERKRVAEAEAEKKRVKAREERRRIAEEARKHLEEEEKRKKRDRKAVQYVDHGTPSDINMDVRRVEEERMAKKRKLWSPRIREKDPNSPHFICPDPRNCPGSDDHVQSWKGPWRCFMCVARGLECMGPGCGACRPCSHSKQKCSHSKRGRRTSPEEGADELLTALDIAQLHSDSKQAESKASGSRITGSTGEKAKFLAGSMAMDKGHRKPRSKVAQRRIERTKVAMAELEEVGDDIKLIMVFTASATKRAENIIAGIRQATDERRDGEQDEESDQME